MPSIGISISFCPLAAFRGFLAGLAAFAGAAFLPTLRRSASIRSTTLPIEAPGLLVHDVLGEIEHVLRDFDVLDLVEILLLGADFMEVARERADEPPVERFERDDVLAFVSTTRPIATLSISPTVSRITAKASWPSLPSGHR